MLMPTSAKPCPLAPWLKNHTAQDLSRASGVNKGSISEFLRRKQRLSRESLDAIAEATNVPVVELLLWQEALEPAKPRRTKRAA